MTADTAQQFIEYCSGITDSNGEKPDVYDAFNAGVKKFGKFPFEDSEQLLDALEASFFNDSKTVNNFMKVINKDTEVDS